MAISGEVNFGRSSGLKQRGSEFDFRKTGLSDAATFEPFVEDAPTEGRMEFLQDLQGELVMSSHRGGEPVEQVLLVGKNACIPHDRFTKRGAKKFPDQGQYFLAEFVARGIGHGVGGILSMGDLPFLEIGEKVCLCDSQKGAVQYQRNSSHDSSGTGLHPGESRISGSPQKLEEAGLHLIVRMVSEHEVSGTVFRGSSGEKLIAGFTRRSLE